MTRDEIKELYFNWMMDLVHDDRFSKKYSQLLRHLDNRDFEYMIPLDGNREEDGMDLRYRFGYEKSYNRTIITTFLNDRPCSILEMMVALAFRCEEHIMSDPEIGNRTGKWFWGMVFNLGLISMDNANYDPEYVNYVLDRFLNREYKANGEGGLFKVKRFRRDMRLVEIWYQMCWYLNEIS